MSSCVSRPEPPAPKYCAYTSASSFEVFSLSIGTFCVFTTMFSRENVLLLSPSCPVSKDITTEAVKLFSAY